MKKKRSRASLNNNPLNIPIGNVWLGEVTNPTDPDFEQFVSLEYGLRAAFVLMRRFINHYHRNTIPELVACWSPMGADNSPAFIDKVYQLAKLQQDEELQYANQEQMSKILFALAKLITQEEINFNVLEKAYKLA